MRAYGSVGEMAVRRIRKEQNKARNVGWIYFLGTIALAVLAFLPFLKINGEAFSVIDYVDWYKNFFKALPDVSKFSYFYVFLSLFLIAILFNALKALFRLGGLHKHSMARKDRNRDAMEKMGSIFSGSFACYVIYYFLYFLFFGWKDNAFMDVELTLFGYLTLGVGLGVHWLAGLVGGGVRKFKNNTSVEEAKRPYGLFLYFLGNLLQLAAVVGILYFFLEISNIGLYVYSVMLQDKFTVCITEEWIYLGLQAATVLCALVLVKHATANTEFNFFGRDGKGMKNFRVFSLLTALFAAGCFGYIWWKTKEAGKAEYFHEYLIVAGIALAIFVLECVLKANWKKSDDETDEIAAVEQPQQPLQQPLPQPAMPPYMPYPMPMPPVVNVHAPYPVPCYVLPMPSREEPKPQPQPLVETVVEEKEESKPMQISKWQILCPTCKKRLTVKDSSAYHCCPACNNVFELRKENRKMLKPGVSQSNKVVEEKKPFSLVDFDKDPFAD